MQKMLPNTAKMVYNMDNSTYKDLMNAGFDRN